MTDPSIRICRVYPRMDMGGAENAILQLLRHIDRTHMVVTHMEGMRAAEAREAAQRYSHLSGPRFAPLVNAMSEASITHLHTINDHLLGPLAALLSGTQHIIQTVHNDFRPIACSLVDYSILVGRNLLNRVDTPERSRVVPNGVPVPDTLPEFRFWCEPGVTRPLRLVELRRPDKLMSTTLDQIARSGALDGLNFEGIGIGFDSPSEHPNIRNIGALSDPYPELARADVLVMGTTTETFGRTVYEAMAYGTLPVATPVPAFTDVFAPDEIHFFEDHEPTRNAIELRRFLDELARDPQAFHERRIRNHRRIRNEFDIATMANRTEDFYTWVTSRPSPPRNFSPADLEGTDVDTFGAILDEVLAPGPIDCRQAIDALPPRARGIVLWTIAKVTAIPDRRRLTMLANAYTLLGPRSIICMDLAHTLRSTGDPRRADSLLEQAIRLDPRNMRAHLERIELLVEMGERIKAITAIHLARTANPSVRYLDPLEERISHG